MGDETIAVVGLGYVGLPLAVAFARKLQVIGFEISQKRVDQLKQANDRTGEVSADELRQESLTFTSDPSELKNADVIIIAVPTPIDDNNDPDLTAVKSASTITGQNLAKNCLVIYESTVYPGVTEEICIPILEKESGMKAGKDFFVGYSPERVNPGDKEHLLTKVVKIVSGQDKATTERVAKLYETIIEPGVYRASSIKVAEAAKAIENTQRDLNIALMNELALIFNKMGISTKEVIEAASTKWNFHKYHPGLVGGHCIAVDPHYLLYKAKQLGYDPKVILAGRDVNDFMPKFVAEITAEELVKADKPLNKSSVLVMGLTFKEDVKDTRNSKIKHTITVLKGKGVKVFGCDPLLDTETIRGFGAEPATLDKLPKVDCIIFSRKHKKFNSLSLSQLKGYFNQPAILIDIAYRFNKEEAKKEGIIYRSM